VRKGNWTIDRLYDKLNNFCLGLYKVLSNLYPNVYEIDLFLGIKARRFLNASRLIKARDDLVPGQLLKFEDPVAIDGELEWTVDKILSSRVHYGELQY
jgi:hypothetical protein